MKSPTSPGGVVNEPDHPDEIFKHGQKSSERDTYRDNKGKVSSTSSKPPLSAKEDPSTVKKILASD